MPVFLILTYISFHLPPPPHGVAVNLLRTAAYVWGFLIGVHGLHFPVLMVCCCCVKAWDGWRGKSSCRSLLVWVRVGTEVGGIFWWAYCSGGFVNSGIWGIHRRSLIIWGSFSKLRTVILAQGKYSDLLVYNIITFPLNTLKVTNEKSHEHKPPLNSSFVSQALCNTSQRQL